MWAGGAQRREGSERERKREMANRCDGAGAITIRTLCLAVNTGHRLGYMAPSCTVHKEEGFPPVLIIEQLKQQRPNLTILYMLFLCATVFHWCLKTNKNTSMIHTVALGDMLSFSLQHAALSFNMYSQWKATSYRVSQTEPNMQRHKNKISSLKPLNACNFVSYCSIPFSSAPFLIYLYIFNKCINIFR